MARRTNEPFVRPSKAKEAAAACFGKSDSYGDGLSTIFRVIRLFLNKPVTPPPVTKKSQKNVTGAKKSFLNNAVTFSVTQVCYADFSFVQKVPVTPIYVTRTFVTSRVTKNNKKITVFVTGGCYRLIKEQPDTLGYFFIQTRFQKIIQKKWV